MDGTFKVTSKFDEILAKSQRLNSQLSGDSSSSMKPLRLGVRELQAVGSATSGDLQGVNEVDNFAAAKFLAQRNFDVFGLSSEVLDMNVETHVDPTERLDSTDLEGYLSHHHDIIVLTAIDDAKRGAQQRERVIQQRWMVENWAVSKRSFIESLGHKSAHRGGHVLSARSSSSASSRPEFVPQATIPFSTAGVPSFRSEVQSSAKSSDSSAALVAPVPQLPELMQAHLAKVKALNDATKRVASRDASRRAEKTTIFTALAQTVALPSASQSDPTAMSKADTTGYRSLLQTLTHMTGENRDDSVREAGSFAPICFNHSGERASPPVQQLHQHLSWGAKLHLEFQLDERLNRDADECLRRNRFDLSRGFGSSRQQRLRALLAYMESLGQLYQRCEFDIASTMDQDDTGRLSHSRTPLWPCVYYSMAVGDLQAAFVELENCVKGSSRFVEREIAIVMHYYVQLQQQCNAQRCASGSGLAVSLSSHEAAEFHRSLVAVRQMYERESAAVEEVDPYRLHVLNLLSLTDRQALADPGFTGYEVEHYLWSSLWFVTYSRQIASMHQQSPLLDLSSGSDMGEAKLLEDVLRFGGADYFDGDNQHPFKFAHILVCCARIGDAISYLWTSGRLLAAVHLAVASLHYGLILPHVPLTQNPVSETVTARTGSGGSSTLTPAAMFQFFFNETFQRAFPEVTLEYFISLQSDWAEKCSGVVHFEVVESNRYRGLAAFSTVLENFLISLDVPELTRLVGRCPGEGPVTTGFLEEIDGLSRSQINLLLTRCAFQLLNSRGEPKKAVYFFKLSGRFSDALTEICRQVSVCIDGDVSQDEVEYWTTTAAQFFDTHIRVGHGPALNHLRDEGQEGLADSLRQLLEVSEFVRLCQGLRWADALQVISNAGLVPKAQQEVQILANRIKKADSSSFGFVVRTLDSVFLYTMRCYQAVLQELSAELAAARAQFSLHSSKLAQVGAVKERAQALVSLVRAVSTPTLRVDTLAAVSKIEVALSV